MEGKKAVFFYGLDELRALAALGVLFHHIELYKNRLQEASLYDYAPIRFFIETAGKHGVYLFFVLSGFLITYLLLEEKEKHGRIALKSFYMRRVLRIWPLYYAIMLLGFFAIPLAQQWPFFAQEQTYLRYIDQMQYGWNFVLFACFLSNLALVFYTPIAAAAQSWSVSVEEQFYLIWPNIIQHIPRKYLPFLFGAVILGLYAASVILYRWPPFSAATTKYLQAGIYLFRIDFMCFGAIGAYIFRYHRQMLEAQWAKWVMRLSLGVLLFGLVVGIHDLVFGTVLMLLMLYVVDRQWGGPVVPWLAKLGKVSYGIYMWHPLVMFVAFAILHQTIGAANAIGYNIGIYLLIPLSTLAISQLSWLYLEKPFLRYKNKFTIVQTRT